MPYYYWYAFAMTFFLALILGKVAIPLLRLLKFGQVVRSDGPATHAKKKGTPTMGGVIFLVPALLVTWLWGITLGFQFSSLVVTTVLTLGFALVGLADDALKAVFRRSLGLLARQKLYWLGVLSAGASLVLYYTGHSTVLVMPFLGWRYDIGHLYWPFLVFIGIGFSNAVNLTDGIDALAGGTMLIASLAYVVVGLVTGVPEVVFFALALAGGLLAFLFYNRHPARVFMGDVGSLGLGGALVSMGTLTRTELLLPIIGAVYVWSTLSVVVQVVYFRLTKGKRFFRMAPFHHALELRGWSERKVVLTYYLVSAVAAALGIVGLARMGG
ncbi:MAG: Phospho-N-acetylmuramoyl-pentapeptide-transferase [Firmicutes bacterium]|nr:Phospho-N-acetylmuramoyl-pentapeptide-transferase [Bacillota bacterium]